MVGRFAAPADARYGAHFRLKSDIAACPKSQRRTSAEVNEQISWNGPSPKAVPHHLLKNRYLPFKTDQHFSVYATYP